MQLSLIKNHSNLLMKTSSRSRHEANNSLPIRLQFSSTLFPLLRRGARFVLACVRTALENIAWAFLLIGLENFTIHGYDMTHTVVTHKACTNGLSSLRLLLI